MYIETVRPGQRYAAEAIDPKTNTRAVIAFTILGLGMFPNETKPGVFYQGALVVTDKGVVAILDFLSLGFCEPQLALPSFKRGAGSEMGIEKTHRRDALRSGLKPTVPLPADLTRADVGKYFVMNASKTSGRVMAREDFLALPLEEIGEWCNIGEFDISP